MGVGQEEWLPRFQKLLIFGKQSQSIRTICKGIPEAIHVISREIIGNYQNLKSSLIIFCKIFLILKTQIVDDKSITN